MVVTSSDVPFPQLARRPSLISVMALSGAVFLAVLCLPTCAPAQVDSPSDRARLATDYEDIRWHEMVFLSFESGRVNRGKVLTKQCLRPPTSEAEVERPRLVETPQGPWDVIMIHTLDKAPLEKTWETPANLEKLRQACVHASGNEAADVNWHEYNDLIARSSSLIGFSGRLGPGLVQVNPTSKDQ